jgi:hypothetical protein
MIFNQPRKGLGRDHEYRTEVVFLSQLQKWLFLPKEPKSSQGVPSRWLHDAATGQVASGTLGTGSALDRAPPCWLPDLAKALSPSRQPLFVALPAGLCKETLLEADTGRGGFSVPSGQVGALAPCEEGESRLEDATKCEPGRSMQSLRLLSQLMSLQKSAKDLPSTAVVRVIN